MRETRKIIKSCLTVSISCVNVLLEAENRKPLMFHFEVQFGRKSGLAERKDKWKQQSRKKRKRAQSERIGLFALLFIGCFDLCK